MYLKRPLIVKHSMDTTFTRIFLFSILLTALIVMFALIVFRYVSSQSTTPYHANSMVAKYQLVEQNIASLSEEFSFRYLVGSQPKQATEDLMFYWQEVRKQIQLNLPPGTTVLHNKQGEDIYLWIRSVKFPNQWVGLPLTQSASIFPFYGWLYVALILMLFILLSYLFARTLSKPFAILSDATEMIAGGGIPQIESRYWPLEAKTLAHTLNTSALRLRDQTTSKEEMLLGISHDLRTPLTRVRLAVDFLHKYEPSLVEGVFADIDEMNLIVEQFISFAREGQTERSEVIDINTLIRDESSKFKNIELDLTAPFEAQVNSVSLRRVLSNLLSNAFKHGEPPIKIQTKNDSIKWSVTVIDMGEGIPENLIEDMVKPFRTADASGTDGKGGLGLAIVDRIVGNHKGSLEFEHRGTRGFAVKVSFPHAAHSRASS